MRNPFLWTDNHGGTHWFPRSWYDRPDGYYPDLRGVVYLGIFVAVVVTFCLAVTVLGVSVDRRNCRYAGRQYHRPTRYDVLAGCYIKLKDGRYIDLDKYRIIRGD